MTPAHADPSVTPPCWDSLSNHIEWQAGAIVSRVMGKTEGGSVTLFAFDEGQELSEHTSPFEAMIVVADGAADIAVGGEHREAAAGSWVGLPAGVPHSIRALSPLKMLLIMLRSPVA